MAATEQFMVPKKAQEAFIQNHRRLFERMSFQWDFRGQMRMIDLAYAREQDLTTEQWRARVANRYGDSNRLQNITIPIMKPQVFAAVAYQAAVFLDQFPIMEVASSPEYQDAAMMMQSVIKENSVRGKWARELILFFYDAFKYNLSAIECSWEDVATAAIETDMTYKGGREGKPKSVIWSGNKLTRWDMYNSYWDTLCKPQDLSTRGEYAGTTELMTRTALKTLMLQLQSRMQANFKDAFESPSLINFGYNTQGMPGYYMPMVNPDVIINQLVAGDSWDTWMGLAPAGDHNKIAYKGLYEVSKEYVRIIPSEFCLEVPAKNTPQIWKLWIVNHSVVIAAERQTNAHEMIPVFFGQPTESGLGYQDKSLAVDSLPFQQVASGLMNSVIASRRRAVTDRVLYDPSRVTEAHINNPNPSAKIPVRPAAQGKPISEAVYQFPYRDDQSGQDLQGICTIVNLANTLNGQNNARQGESVPGNKTDQQWADVMGNATSHDRSYALMFEAQVFTPMKEVLKINMLQYQQKTSVYDPTTKQTVEVDPIALRNAVLNYTITDGYLPKDKVLNTETMQVLSQVIGSSPTLAQGYNIGPMFTYISKTQNVDFGPFQKSPPQIAYESAQQNWSMLAQLAIQKGAPFQVPQPIPAQFGYDPNAQSPTSGMPTQGVANAQPAAISNNPSSTAGGQ